MKNSNVTAVIKRQVHLKILVNSKASHKSLMLKHLQKLKQVNPQLIEMKIYDVSNWISTILRRKDIIISYNLIGQFERVPRKP